MSLLHQNSTEELDDAARGDELTRGTSHVVLAGVISAIVVTILIAIYVIAGQKPPLATGEVIAVWVHPQKIETSGVDANGAPLAKQSFEQMMAFAQVRLHNQSKQPLFLSNILTNATFGDGIHSSYAAGAAEYNRIFLAYPGIQVPHGQALPLELTLAPGQTVEGTFVSAFRMNKEQWDARKNLNFSFAFRYEPNLVLTPHVAITEQ
jgi:hypothetical protein